MKGGGGRKKAGEFHPSNLKLFCCHYNYRVQMKLVQALRELIGMLYRYVVVKTKFD